MQNFVALGCGSKLLISTDNFKKPEIKTVTSINGIF